MSTARALRDLTAASVFVVVVLALSACSAQGSWYRARTPTVSMRASRPCPASVGAARDVRPAGSSNSTLVPDGAHPVEGLVCIYAGALRPSTGVRQIRLDATQSSELAQALSTVSLKAPPLGPVNCPEDSGSFAIIALGYSSGSDTDVWWQTTGCQTLDNGTVGASEIANTSFARFQTTFAKVADLPNGPGVP